MAGPGEFTGTVGRSDQHSQMLSVEELPFGDWDFTETRGEDFIDFVLVNPDRDTRPVVAMAFAF